MHNCAALSCKIRTYFDWICRWFVFVTVAFGKYDRGSEQIGSSLMVPEVCKECPGKQIIEASNAMLVVLVSHQGGDYIFVEFKKSLWP